LWPGWISESERDRVVLAGGRPYTPEEDDAVLTARSYDDFVRLYPHRTLHAYRKRKEILQRQGRKPSIASGFLPAGDQPTLEPAPPLNLPSWREFVDHIEGQRAFRQRTTYSTNFSSPLIHATEPIGLIALSDLHIGAWGVDYRLLVRVIDEILAIPNLFIILLGDVLELAVKLRSVAEVIGGSAITPEAQYAFAESLLDELAPRVAGATWGNHDAREEALLGTSRIGRLYAERGVVYHAGIAHIDLQVGQETYRIAATHHYRGRSIYNPVHGPQRYLIMDSNDREIAMAGDSHAPGQLAFVHGERFKVAINSGTTHVNSGYGQRYFSLFTEPAFPLVELWPNEHRIVPFWSIRDWLGQRGHSAPGRVD
jgi:hypothetical protein